MLVFCFVLFRLSSCARNRRRRTIVKTRKCTCISEKVFYVCRLFLFVFSSLYFILFYFEYGWTNNKLAKKKRDCDIKWKNNRQQHKYAKRKNQHKNQKSFGLLAILYARFRNESWFNKPLHSITIPLQFEFVYE